jgi:hypothetical protein
VPQNQPDRLAGALRRVGYDARHLSAYAQQGERNYGMWTHQLQTIGRRG